MDRIGGLGKDIIEYVTNFTDDRDILNWLSANGDFSDSLFKRILEKRYPLLIRFKTGNETWRQFYLKMVKYIALINENFHIPYIPNEYFNPESFYKRHKNGLGITFAQLDAMNKLVLMDRKDLIKQIVDSLINNETRSLVLQSGIGLSRQLGKTDMENFLRTI